jgi:hypothetical protein
MHRRQDRFHHAVDFLQHIIVPETQDAIALRLKIRGSLCIFGNILRLIVLRAVNLNDDTPVTTGEVSEVRTNSRLSPEV